MRALSFRRRAGALSELLFMRKSTWALLEGWRPVVSRNLVRLRRSCWEVVSVLV